MKRIKITRETIGLSLILILSAVLNFANIGIEGYGNTYYASGVKSMTMSLKNFFFVSFDSAGFVTIDKPPIGFWVQAICAKIFGFSGYSILLPQAIAGVISVYLIYYIVKRSFGITAGVSSALCLAVTPVFVAASRNNTIDNLLVVTLLFACLALTIGAEKGKTRYLYISLVLVGIGFNIKMLEAYMIGPAIYISYLLSSTVSFKKKISHLVIGTVILLAVSLFWTVIVDLVPAQNRPFVGSSTNNSVIELIVGHNGLERLGIGKKSDGKAGGNDNNTSKNNQKRSENIKDTSNANNQENLNYNENGQGIYSSSSYKNSRDGGNMQMFNEGNLGYGLGEEFGGMPGGVGLRSFGGQAPATITRLFSKNSLSDQIVWFLPLALLGFIAGAIKEKLRLKLDNKRKVSLVLWFTWVIPEFIYFSFTKGLFHPYYLTMMAPPIAALAGIGISTMWQLYKEDGWKSCFLPSAFIIEGATHMLMLFYYSNISTSVRNLIILALLLCFISSILLIILKLVRGKDESKSMKLKKGLVRIGLIGILTTPFIGATAAISHKLNSTIPCAGLELLSNNKGKDNFGKGNSGSSNGSNTKLIEFLESNKADEKYLLAASSSQSIDDIIIKTSEPVMAIGGFSGSDKILSLDQFKELVKNGEVRYVLTGGIGRGGNSEIMNWITQNGKLVPESEYKDSSILEDEQTNNKEDIKTSQNKGFEPNAKKYNANNDKNQDLRKQNVGETEGRNSGQLYDLKDVADTLK